MNKYKGNFFTGYISFQCKGENIEILLNECLKENVIIWDISTGNSMECYGNIKYIDYSSLEEICKQLNFEITILQEHGLPFIFKRLIAKKELVLSFIFSIVIILFLSNIVWSIHITGLPEEIERKVEEQLKEYGVTKGNFIFHTPQPSSLQQQLINDIPELLWIGVERKGTTFHFEGVEKIIVNERESLPPRHLIANKQSIVKKLHVKQGQPVVKVNDFVKENDLLISGKIPYAEEEVAENIVYVAAEGEVYGETWYEISISLPLEGKYDRLTGERIVKDYFDISSISIPYYGFWKKEFKQYVLKEEIYPVYFLFWKTPFNIKKQYLYESVPNYYSYTYEEAVEKGVELAIERLKRQIGQDITIVTKNVLQETEENGKVNLILFIAVEENIVKSRPLSQGD